MGDCACPDCRAELDPQRTIDAMLAIAAHVGDDPGPAELVAATLLGLGPPELAEDALAATIVPELEARATAEALGLLLAIRAVAPDRAGKAAGVAADRLLDAGVMAPRWVAELDAPLTLVACVRVAGSLLGCTFERAGRAHSFLIDVAGGRAIAMRHGPLAGAELDAAEFRWYVERALDRPVPTDEPATFEDGPALEPLVRARLTAFPAPREPRETDAGSIYRLKVTLRGDERRVEVPAELTLAELHETIKAAFDWDGEHLYAFDTALGEFGPERGHVRLAQVAPGVKSRLRYTYDFADDRQHDISVEKVLTRQ